MDIHVEAACAGLRELAKGGATPDYLLYTGCMFGDVPPDRISGIIVIETPMFISMTDMESDVRYVPCYRQLPSKTFYKDYLDAYIDVIFASKENNV